MGGLGDCQNGFKLKRVIFSMGPKWAGQGGLTH